MVTGRETDDPDGIWNRSLSVVFRGEAVTIEKRPGMDASWMDNTGRGITSYSPRSMPTGEGARRFEDCFIPGWN